jgi:hypothetical protein
MRKARLGLSVLAAVAGLLACSSDTAILLRIDTDLRVPEELNGLRIRVATEAKLLMDKTYSISTQDEIPATLRIIAENDKEVPVTITVDGLLGADPVARAEATATFVKGETVDADVFLARGSAPHDDGGFDAGGRPDAGGSDVSDLSDVPDAPDASDAGLPADAAGDIGDGAPDADAADAGALSDASDPSDVSDTGPPADTGGDDAADPDVSDASDLSDLSDTPDAGLSADAADDDGSQLGFPCDPDAGCGGGLMCFTETVPGGYCTSYCEGDGCPPNGICLRGLAPDAGLCVRTCSVSEDCDYRPGSVCVPFPSADASICGPSPPDGGGADAGSDAGACPRVEVTMLDPAGAKVGVGETAAFAADYFDAACTKNPAAAFAWRSDLDCLSFADGAAGTAVGEYIQPACTVYATADNVTGTVVVSVEAVVTTFSGSGVEGHQDGAPESAQFNKLTVGTTDNFGALFVVDVVNQTGTYRIRRIDSSGNVSTLADNMRRGCADGDVNTYSITSIGDVAAEGLSGELYFSDPGCNALRKLASGNVETLFTSPAGFVDGDEGTGRINEPRSLALTGGALFFYDSKNFAVRMYNFAKDSVSTFAGSGIQGHKDGAALDAFIEGVQGLALHGTYTLLFTDWPGFIRYSDGSQVGTLGGTANVGFKDGPLATAEFNEINNIVVLDDGSVFVSDAFNHSVRQIDFGKAWISTVAGGSCSCFADGLGSEAGFFYPQNIIAANNGPVLFVLDQFNYRVRKVRLSRY